jgi:hypothetical protein
VAGDKEITTGADQARRPESEADDRDGVDDEESEMEVQGFRRFNRFT